MSFIDKLEQIEKNHKITMTRKINHLSIAGIIIGLLILLYFLNDVKYNVYKNESKALLLKLDDRLMLKRNVAISNVVALSNDMRIIEALKNNDKSKMKDVLSQLSKRYKDMTTFKNVKVHVHTKDNKSFFRSWKNKNGDDLSWRDTVVNVNRNHKTVIAFEVGKAGLTLKAVIPLFDENRRHIGSIEFIQGLNSVAKRFKKTDDAFILLMNKSQLQTAKFMKNPKSLQDFIVAQNFLDNDFYNDALSLDFDKLKKDNYYLGENYFYSYKDVTDTKDRVIGMMLVASKMDKIDKLIERSSFLILITIFMMFIATAILKVVLNFGIVKSFKKVVDLLSISSSKIENASIVLTKSSGDLSNMSASQSASVEEILATIEQTSENISNNFNNMLNLEKLGSQVESKANTGYEHMKELSASMNNISKSSKDINTIVNTIDEIAFQTNLLALNAAVEAARAGEHGLGFAVVSDEVRNLATRSSTESQKIHAVIENAVKEAEYGISVTDSTHESFKDILKTVENTMSVISEVTLSSNEQKEAVEQIKVAMSEVDLVTQNLAMNSAEISSSAESLSEQVKQTNNIVKNIHQMI